MSRLYDRLLAEGCRPLSARDIWAAVVDTDGEPPDYRFVAEELLGRHPSREDVADIHDRIRQSLSESVSDDVLARSEVEGAVVVSAEEVADYVGTFPSGTDIAESLVSVVPPFDPTFVEFQKRPNRFGLDSWGVLFSTERHAAAEGWTLHAAVVGEWKRGDPVGPLVRYVSHLDSSGTITSGVSAHAWELSVEDPEASGVDEDRVYTFATIGMDLLSPGLFAVSLMHCKNVLLRHVDPPERLSRKHERRKGVPLTRYHVLEIAPMRRVLDTDGEAQTRGLPHALHICRGHFKTFTEDAPLFGKRVGTYWWPAHVRGASEQGVVEKGYRIRLDGSGGLGQEYREADEEATVAPAQVRADDPDTSQRGLRAHNATQNLLAAALRDAGFDPRSPKSDEPDFDLAWMDGETVWVAEVKSATEANEEKQLRLAVGQVLRYRQLLSTDGQEVRAMIAIENAPFDESLLDLCGREGIALVWPEVMAQALAE